jgi:phosphoribosyl-AMP cyclohydrolase / phosphoribosyl-ATP pyrophosphohydrolase
MINIANIQFEKYADNLVPAIIQDGLTSKVLMLGFMNEAAVLKTIELKQVTFFSRSKNRLWTKGEESGNYLLLKNIKIDCDNDTLLITVTPQGPTCHTGADTCWNEQNSNDNFLVELEKIITNRKNNPSKKSYVNDLFLKGINKIAQKLGEEAIELVIEAKDDNDELFVNEAGDLLFHYLILLQAKGFNLKDVVQILKQRNEQQV